MLRILFNRSGDWSRYARRVGRDITIVAQPLSKTVQRIWIELSIVGSGAIRESRWYGW